MKRKMLVIGVLGLLAIGLAGCMALFNRAPIAEFSWSPATPYAGFPVTFDASLSHDPDRCDEIVSYKWDFGDGTTITESSPKVTHTYKDDSKRLPGGVYIVTLKVTDSHGCSSSLTKNIRVLNPNPEIKDIDIYDYNGYRYEAGDRLRFCANALDPASLGLKSIAQIKWDFGDRSAPQYGQCVNHCYSRGCRYYTIKVTVTDDDRATASLEETIFIYCKDGCPKAVIQITPSRVHKDDTVILNGRSSYDRDRCCVPCPDCPRDCSLDPACNGRYYCDGTDRIVSWRWEIFPPTGDSIVRWGARIEFTPTQTGSYLIQLSVKDDENNWDTTVKQIEVLP